LAIPAEPESVTVGGRGRFQRLDALHHERVRRRGYVLFERDGLPAIGDPSAHGAILHPDPQRGFNIIRAVGKKRKSGMLSGMLGGNLVPAGAKYPCCPRTTPWTDCTKWRMRRPAAAGRLRSLPRHLRVEWGAFEQIVRFHVEAGPHRRR